MNTARYTHEGEGHGRGHWMAHKVTAVINLCLGVWALAQFVKYDLGTYTGLYAWLEHTTNKYLLMVMLVSMCLHLLMGTQVIVEDYIHHKTFKAVKLWGQRVFFSALTIVAIIGLCNF